jgi:hypothetical protein
MTPAARGVVRSPRTSTGSASPCQHRGGQKEGDHDGDDRDHLQAASSFLPMDLRDQDNGRFDEFERLLLRSIDREHRASSRRH